MCILRFAILSCICLIVASCSSSVTKSDVSKADIPAGKYQKILVSIQERDSTASPATVAVVGVGTMSFTIPTGGHSTNTIQIEEKILSALTGSGVSAISGVALFKGKTLSEDAKARIVQKDFEALLYISIIRTVDEERLAAVHNGVQVRFANGEVIPVSDLTTDYRLDPNGSVYFLHRVVTLKSELQDTKSAKIVWAAETVGTGAPLTLASQMSAELTAKMRGDGIIN